jgi:hypothetical protein
MKYTLFVSMLFLLNCQSQSPKPQQDDSQEFPTYKTRYDSQTTVNQLVMPSLPKDKRFKIVHVFVALCDNDHQSIVKVPPKIGNGKDAEENLYWGCDLGTKTFLKKHKDWTLLQTIKNQRDKVLERCVFKHKTTNTLLVADAYDGEFIKKCTIDFLKSCAGDFNDSFHYGNETISAGGNADLLAYIGHDGLMDFELSDVFKPKNDEKRSAIMLACTAKTFFAPYLKQTGAQPLVWTTGLMAPEAYTLVAAVNGWIQQKPNEAIREAAAQAYHQYQKCGIKSARNLLVNGY